MSAVGALLFPALSLCRRSTADQSSECSVRLLPALHGNTTRPRCDCASDLLQHLTRGSRFDLSAVCWRAACARLQQLSVTAGGAGCAGSSSGESTASCQLLFFPCLLLLFMDLCGRVSRRSCHACRPLSARGSSCPAHSRPSVCTVARESQRFPPTHLLSLRSDAAVRLSGWVLNASHLQLPCTRADKQLASLEAQKCGLALVLLHTNRQDCQRPHDSESYSVYIVNCAARLTAM